MAATVDTADGISPQDLLKEVRSFLHGVSSQVHNISRSESLTRSALVLLRTLPTARHAVLEYLANLFDEAVNSYLLELDIGHKVTDSGSSLTDGLLHDACGVLHSFIHTHSTAWAPIISSWSLELLGHISSKYSDRRGMPHTGSLNELLQLWMTCKPTKLLIEVATECFAQMVEGAPETCVDALLEASVKYSPHFDWVVAHIGSCFPTSIITRVLMCGLKDYCHHGSRGDVALDEKIPKMGSVVGILGHLASKHSQNIRTAFMKLFQDTLDGNPNVPNVMTIPFLLQLASMSPMLLHIMATDIVNALTPPVLNKLHVLFMPWRQSSPHEFDSMMTLVIHLVMQSDVGADRSLSFLMDNATCSSDHADNAAHPLPEIQKTCALLVDQILNETESFLIRRSRSDTGHHLEIPYLAALSPKLPQLTKDMLHSEPRKSKWLQRLVCYIIIYQGEKQGSETLAQVLAQAETTQQLSHFLYVQQNIEVAMPRVLDTASQKILDQLEPHTDTDKLRLVKNLYQVIEWEKTSKENIIRSQFKESLQPHWLNLSNLLLHDDQEVAMVTINILNYVPIPVTLSSGAVVKVCGALVTLFFRALEIEDNNSSNSVVHACSRCAKLLARREYAQCILVQFLIEGAISKENKPLFGGKTDVGTSRVGTHDAQTSLLHENKKHGLSLTIQRSHSSVFHAGVIGEGLRRGAKQQVYPQTIVKRNHSYLLEMLWSCCQDSQTVPQTPTIEGEEHHHASKNYSLTVSPDLSRMIGSMIVELTTPDVLYNNRFWPEEESLKMTVERDLQVWKMFDDNPVLWEVMAMLASSSLVMSRCSVVLKSLTATLMHHFESSREKTARNSPKHLECACHVIRCLAKSCLLPVPLSYLPELLPLVTPFEVYLLLLTVWRYMKETPPTEDPDEVSRRVCTPRHTEVVRAIIHKNIDNAGFLYARFFNTSPSTDSIPELQDPGVKS